MQSPLPFSLSPDFISRDSAGALGHPKGFLRHTDHSAPPFHEIALDRQIESCEPFARGGGG
jgi:hypothetical protein